MDKDRAKELLRAIYSCQESGCQDDCDAACALLESDSELQAWFEEEMESWTEFDRAVASKLDCCRAPEALREQCKAPPGGGGLLRFVVPAMAAAALFMVGFFIFGGAPDPAAPLKPLEVAASGLGLENLRSDMVALVNSRNFELHHTAEKMEDLKSWLVAAGAPSGDMKPCIVCKKGVGCALVDWGEQKVSMICVSDQEFGGKGVVHVFVVDRSLFKKEEVDVLVANGRLEGELHTGGFADDDKVYVLVGDEPDVSVESLL